MNISKQKFFGTIVGLVLIAVLLTSYVLASVPSTTLTFSSGVYPGAPTYTVYGVSGTYYAKDQNGAQLFPAGSTNASYIINSAFQSLSLPLYDRQEVLLLGVITIDAPIKVRSETILHLKGALYVAEGANVNAIEAERTDLVPSTSNPDVTHDYEIIIDGTVNGNDYSQSAYVSGIVASGYDFRITATTVEQCKGAGIVIQNAQAFAIKYAQIDECNGNGLEFRNASSGYVTNIIVTENELNGIKVFGTQDGYAVSHGLNFGYTFSAYNYGHGVVIDNGYDIAFSSGVIKDNSYGNIGVCDGVLVQNPSGSGCYNIKLSNLDIIDDQGTKSQNYGVRTLHDSDKVFVQGCNLAGNIQAMTCSLVGSNNHVKNNEGYLTENWISLTCNGAQQTVAHGLDGITGTNIGVIISNQDNATAYGSAAPDGTNIYITGGSGKVCQIWVWARDDTDPK